MIYEWYSGSDASQGIPEELSELNRQFFDVPIEERLRVFNSLLDREEDPNWRGYFRFCIALDLKAIEQTDDSKKALTEAIREFDPLAGNIRDVMPQYTGALLRMIVDHLRIDADAETIAEYAAVLVANQGESMLGSFDTALSYLGLARALNRIGTDHRLPLCYTLALHFAIRAHHAEPDEPLFLEHLIYCYFNVRDADHCRLAYEMFGKVGPPLELKQRVDEFMRTRFHEIGGTLDVP